MATRVPLLDIVPSMQNHLYASVVIAKKSESNIYSL